MQRARELDAFDQQNHGAVPQYGDRRHSNGRNDFHGANSVKVTSYEEEALHTMKAFWLPSATPEAPIKVYAPSTSTVCPEGKEKLKLKSLFPVHFTEDGNEQKKSKLLETNCICPSCQVTLTNTLALAAVSTCGYVFARTVQIGLWQLIRFVWHASHARRRTWCRWRKEELDSLGMEIIWRPLNLNIWAAVQFGHKLESSVHAISIFCYLVFMIICLYSRQNGK